MARHDLDEILAHGKVEHGYLGILPQDVTPALAKAFNTTETNGALVGEITPNSPAAHSSLKQGDMIVAVNGQPISDASQLRSRIGMMDPNTTVTLKVLRDGKTQDVAVTLGQYPSKEERASVQNDNSDNSLQGVYRGEPYAGYGPGVEAPGHHQGRCSEPGEPCQPRGRCWFAARRRDSAGESSVGSQCQ